MSSPAPGFEIRGGMSSPAPGFEIRGVTRSSFLLKGVLATGALCGAGAAGPFVRRAFGQEAEATEGGRGDVAILNFALSLEYLEAAFYGRATETLALSGPVAILAQEIRSNEEQHVGALVDAIERLNGTPAKKPEVRFNMRDEAHFLALAQALEDTGASAYVGVAPLLADPAALASTGSIAQTEGRHAGTIRMIRGEKVSPGPLEPSLTASQVKRKLSPFFVDPR